LDITKLLPTHPVLLFALQPFADDGVEKARPENPWKRGYNTEYFRVRDAVLARKPLCYKCRKNQAMEVDHVRPLINGGSNTVGNLRPICRSCNRKSGGGERRVKKSVRVDAMVQLAFDKASFGGDRSAAGRYAAEQRWRGHVKGENRYRSKKDNRWGPDRRIAGQYSFIERKWEIDKMPALEGISTEVLYRLATNFDDPQTSVVMGAGSASVDSLDQLRESGASNTNNLELALPPKDDRTAIVHAIVVGIFRNWESDADRRPAIIAKQAVRELFGLTDSKEVPTSGMIPQAGPNDPWRAPVAPLPPEEYDALKAVMRAIHQRTQMHLADTGLKENDTVTLYRALQRGFGADRLGTTIDYQTAPLTSFTRLREVADDWDSARTVLTAKVPRTKVLFINNVFLHGGWMGEENEVILLGGKIEVSVSAPNPKKKDEDE
jgi:hypothetical protein